MNKFFKSIILRVLFIIASFIVIGLVTSQLRAQETGVISGSVIDKTTGLPVEGVDVTINRVKDSSFVKGIQTDAAGKFKG
jgi:hypothetical protein